MSLMTSYSTPHRSDEGEKPFWISYADLMTALMILFLVIMVAALAAITKKVERVIEEPTVDSKQPPAEVRAKEIASICDFLADKAVKIDQNATVDCRLNRISFGEVGRFRTDEYKLGPDADATLSNVVPIILEAANSPLGKKWLKQVVIEGFTDTDGSYLYNLNLSLKRSEWVMCMILGHAGNQPIDLTPDERKQIKRLFLAGGVSFNNIRDSKDASRRVELRLQFYGLGETPALDPFHAAKFEGEANERCMLR